VIAGACVCHNNMTDTCERWDWTSGVKLAVKRFVYLAFSAVAVYLLAFVVLVFVPGLANKLRVIGVNEVVLEKVFYPLLHLIR
jgi:hypothetical protein